MWDYFGLPYPPDPDNCGLTAHHVRKCVYPAYSLTNRLSIFPWIVLVVSMAEVEAESYVGHFNQTSVGVPMQRNARCINGSVHLATMRRSCNKSCNRSCNESYNVKHAVSYSSGWRLMAPWVFIVLAATDGVCAC